MFMLVRPIVLTLFCASVACAESLSAASNSKDSPLAVQEEICWHALSAEQIRALLEQGVDPNSHVGE